MLVATLIAEKDRGAKLLVFFSFLAIGVLIAFRSTRVGADTANYYRMYAMIANDTMNTEDLEIGFVWLVKLLYRLSDEPQTLFVVQGLLVAVSGFYFVLKNTSDVTEAYIAILAFLAFNLFSFHLSGIRQSFAMSICLFSYESLKKKKFWSFLLITGIASLFHASAAFFIPAYFVANATEKKARIWAIIGTVVGVLFLERIMDFFSIFNDRFSKYEVESTDNGYVFFAVMLLITVYDLMYGTVILKKTTLDQLHSKINYVSAGMWLMRLFTRTIERISFFYLPSTMILLAHTHGAMRTKEDKRLYTLLLSVLLAVLYLYRMSGWRSYSFCVF